MRSEDRVGEELRSVMPEERRSPMAKGFLAWAGAFVMACCLALPQAAAADPTPTWSGYMNPGEAWYLTCLNNGVPSFTKSTTAANDSFIMCTSPKSPAPNPPQIRTAIYQKKSGQNRLIRGLWHKVRFGK